ncbi:acyl-CoA dehydrogenase family protein [Streptomyces sp. NPDC058045]|uniref:acyl-CoA dehydrogenase family protein n=1 Tax=Streptomyces sp. NPDC058045 TaxID=3346311 RepID=UPI0036E8C185
MAGEPDLDGYSAEDAALVRAAEDFVRASGAAAADWDRAGGLPAGVVRQVAAAGLLAPDLPGAYGGRGIGPGAVGGIAAALGGVCGSLRGLFTVQGMVAAALARWGTRKQRAEWLPSLATGELLAGFAATEPGAGTALGAVRTRIEPAGALDVTVDGHKRWITFGADADLLLVLGTMGGKPSAVLVETDRPGVTREEVHGQLGLRAARIAHVRLDGVRVPRTHLVAPAGLGLSHVVGTALDHGRFTVAWGCVGMAEACVEDAAAHAANRRQGEQLLGEQQLVRSLLATSAVAATGARELARSAARARARGWGHGVPETLVAKYAAASAAASASRDAVQMLGSAGIEPDSRAGRHFRDAKVMEIIEGAQQVLELHIAERLLRRFATVPGAAAVRTAERPS